MTQCKYLDCLKLSNVKHGTADILCSYLCPDVTRQEETV